MAKLSYTAYNLTQDKKRIALRFVDFKNNPRDRLCAELLRKGRTNWLINKRTGYSDGQIRYRAVLLDLDRTAIRNERRTAYTRDLLDREKQDQHEIRNSTDAFLKRMCPHMFANHHHN